jgi:N-acyl-D-amino-acid deacylase
MLDAVIKNSTLFGLENGGSAKTDLSIKDGMVVKVGESDDEAAEIIDGDRLLTLPGFVDVHSHSDYYLLFDPQAQGKIMQGVTTEIGGNCGYSSAPIDGEILKIRREAFMEQFGLELDWKNFDEYWERLGRKGSSVNYAGLIGYNTLRASVVGTQDKKIENDHIEKMKELVRNNLSQGAAGMSIGLVYPPACFSSVKEVVAVAEEVQKAGKVFTAHIRSEGKTLVESIEEILEIARLSGVRLQISHLKTAGKDNWHKLDKVFELIENAKNEGMDISADRYPYIASNTGLQVLLPDWAFDGGRDATIDRLNDKETRKKMWEEILVNHPEKEYWDTVMVSQVSTKKNYDLQGLRVSEGAKLRGKDMFDYIFDLLVEEKTEVEAIYFCMDPDNMDRVVQKEYVMVGSDSGARTIDGPLGIGRPHPRTFGTFPRFFSDYVFNRKIITMEEAVRKTSTAACERFGLEKRGKLAEGYHADIVMINPDTIRDTTTYENPLSYPEGVENVFVNGRLAVRDGKYLGTLSGKGIRVN